MEQEYKVGLFSRAFYGMLAVGGGSSFAFLMLDKPPENKAIYLLPLTVILFCFLLIVNLFRSRVLLTATGITRDRAFYSKTLNFEDVKGVRIGSKVIVIEPKDEFLGKFKISNYGDLTNPDELIKELRERFIDLDQVDIDLEKQELLTDPALGDSIQAREETIVTKRQIAIAYSIWGFIMFFVLVFIRNSYASFWVGVLYPTLGILIMQFSKGLIKFVSDSQRSAYIGISIGFCMPVILPFLTGLIEFEVLDNNNVWPFTALFSLILFIPLYFIGINKNASSVTGQVIGMALICLMFGFGCTITVNCLFDKSAPTKVQTKVEDEYISSGKGNHYHIKLAPWYKSDDQREVDVSEKEYFRSPIGSTVTIYQRNGLFDITWFKVEVPSAPPPVEGLGDPPTIK